MALKRKKNRTFIPCEIKRGELNHIGRGRMLRKTIEYMDQNKKRSINVRIKLQDGRTDNKIARLEAEIKRLKAKRDQGYVTKRK